MLGSNGVREQDLETCQAVWWYIPHTMYSGPPPKGHSLQDSPLERKGKFLAGNTMNAGDAPSHQRTPL